LSKFVEIVDMSVDNVDKYSKAIKNRAKIREVGLGQYGVLWIKKELHGDNSGMISKACKKSSDWFTDCGAGK